MVEQENHFVDKYVKLRHKVMSVTWTDEVSRWTMVVRNLETEEEFEDHVDIIIDGGGILNKWKWVSGLVFQSVCRRSLNLPYQVLCDSEELQSRKRLLSFGYATPTFHIHAEKQIAGY